ncbi:DUF4177 domain-containing protein [uncultured Ruminococcus sp.]|uniref:DUF4177 domain-containing protein n=1 Tax=uncultured Ruminococcus sp. TaxID=165186 RepID=UPI000ECBFEAF|nr:DUF4177 domain-containing protein [uncultured Ruminococcus sp.]HCJ41153.1 DUF4177 domain-containing protein [Ruminococcus sp.]
MNAELKKEIMAVLADKQTGIDPTTLSDEDLRTYITLMSLKNDGKNHKMEYAVETVRDRDNGGADESALADVLAMYGEKGWRLKFCFTDEVGVESHSATVAGYTTGTNATINEIVLIFERRGE